MKSNRPYAKATITPKGQRAIEAGHPWVYEGEVERVEGTEGAESAGFDEAPDMPSDNGFLVDVLSRKGSYLGTGLYSAQSKIRIRLITRNANDAFDQAFWTRKVRWCWEYRKTAMGRDLESCRVIFSEADGFPGLIVDRFCDVLVAQVLSVGMERVKPQVFAALAQVFAEDGVDLRGIYERNDSSTRVLEGLEQTSGWYAGEGVPFPENPDQTITLIVENGVRYEVDFADGQKTGFFLDQKYNRAAVARLAPGKRVLDCFTHTGSFALNAALAGADHVTAVDISELAINQARKNAELNGVKDRMDFVCENVFDLLTRLEQEKCRDYDFIVLDPPAFTKSRRTIDQAARGYKDINYRALKILPRGGYLATCSCSHFMDTDRFKQMVAAAARDAGVQLRQIEQRQQAPDHPILWGVPETDYLKFFLFQVV